MKLELNDIHTMISWAAEKKLSLLEYQDADMRIRIGGPGMPPPLYDRMPDENDSLLYDKIPDGYGQNGMGIRKKDGQPYAGTQTEAVHMSFGAQAGDGNMPSRAQAGDGSMSAGAQAWDGSMPSGAQAGNGSMFAGKQARGVSSAAESGTEGSRASVPGSDSAPQSGVSVHVIESPLVGTFFAAPSEDGEPYVRAGDTVKSGQVVGIVEAMKLMNEIEADCDGVIEEILVRNEQMVEYGQPLMLIRIQPLQN